MTLPKPGLNSSDPGTCPSSSSGPVEYLIIGQGLSGTFLSWEMQKARQSFIVIDEGKPFTASKIASGIINPVTGRRMVKTWMIDELIPFAWNAYTELGEELRIPCIKEVKIIDFFPTPQMRMAFINRLEEDQQYLSMTDDAINWDNYLNYQFGCGVIHPCLLVNMSGLLKSYKDRLLQNGQFRNEYFEEDQLIMHKEGIQYKDIRARKIIFCDGINCLKNAYFKNLPFAPNKGEVLIVEIKDLPQLSILKRGINIVPWKDNLFWIGSSYEWQFANDQPTILFREKILSQLKSFCKLPFTLIDHWAAVRPATLERRPFTGFHPAWPPVGVFNGMGTKGCSLAPFFARQFVKHLTQQSPLMPEADVLRFKKILSR